jgi:hypothetical protein
MQINGIIRPFFEIFAGGARETVIRTNRVSKQLGEAATQSGVVLRPGMTTSGYGESEKVTQSLIGGGTAG